MSPPPPPARWAVCVSCPRSRRCAAAARPMARSAAGGAGATAASAPARPRRRGSSTARAASATTGSAPRTTGWRATVGLRRRVDTRRRPFFSPYCLMLRGEAVVWWHTPPHVLVLSVAVSNGCSRARPGSSPSPGLQTAEWSALLSGGVCKYSCKRWDKLIKETTNAFQNQNQKSGIDPRG